MFVYVSREYSRVCMLKRNRYLVDHTACLLAACNLCASAFTANCHKA